MKEIERKVGREILEGLRELKRGEHGRVIDVPDVMGIRKEAGGTDRSSSRPRDRRRSARFSDI